VIRAKGRVLTAGIILFVAVAGAACAGGSAERTGGKRDTTSGPGGTVQPLNVMVSILPQEYLVSQIGGTGVRVGVMVPPGREPHTYEPTPRQISEVAHARLYFRIGMPFEDAFLPRVEANVPDLRVVDTRVGVTLRSPDGRQHMVVTANSPAVEGFDPHIWLGPRELAIQMKTIRDALVSEVPGMADTFTANYNALVARLHALDGRLKVMLAPLRGSSILVFHPAFGYFTDTYGIEELAIEQNGKNPGPREMQDLIRRARAAHVRAVFVEPEFSETTAKRIAEALGVRMLVINPLAPDVLSNLETMAKTLLAGAAGP
jgi:zinc transport system substrate-binding protein